MTQLDVLAEEIERDRKDCAPYRLVLASGFFDCVHPGHLQYLDEAGCLGTHLLVVVNGTPAAIRKKGFEFMPVRDRVTLIERLVQPDYVLVWDEPSTAEVIRRLRPDVVANGGDRSDLSALDPREVATCQELAVRITTGVGGAMKYASSTEMVRRAATALGYTPPR